MPIDHVSLTDPYSGAVLDSGWAFCSDVAFDFDGKSGRLLYKVYTSKQAAYSGRPPIRTVEFRPGPAPTPAVLGPAELLDPGSPAVYGDPDPETGVAPLITPAVPPTYSEPAVVRAAVPSLPQLIAANAEAYTLLQAACDEMALEHPEFAGGVIDPVAS